MNKKDIIILITIFLFGIVIVSMINQRSARAIEANKDTCFVLDAYNNPVALPCDYD